MHNSNCKLLNDKCCFYSVKKFCVVFVLSFSFSFSSGYFSVIVLVICELMFDIHGIEDNFNVNAEAKIDEA